MIDPEEMKRRSRGICSDMSPRAIDKRLAIAAELYDLWRFFRSARRIGPVAEEEGEGAELDILPTEVCEPDPESYGGERS